MRGDFVYFLFVSLICLNEFFASTLIRRKKIIFIFSSFKMSTNPRKPSNCLVFKKKRKIMQTQKPIKNQGEN
jgi:hypothetical protein